MHTAIDCFEKRGKKGYLFTIGDECPTPKLYKDDIIKVLGTGPQSDLTCKELLSMVSRQYEVFHIMIEEGNYMRSAHDRVVNEWTNLLGQRAIKLSDHTKLAEVIVSTIQVMEGEDKSTVVSSWDGTTGLVVGSAINSLVAGAKPVDGVVM